MRGMRHTGALLLAALAVACGGDRAGHDTSAPAGPTVRDSAGVPFVANGTTPPGGWRVGAEPLFTVGWHPDGPAFTWPQSGRILPDGGALIGEFGAGAIYRVAADGSVAGTWGRKGEGPGEYRSLDALVLAGDSVLVSDVRLQRLTALSLDDGEVLGTGRLPGGFPHRLSAVLDDGRLLLVPGEGYGGNGDLRPEWVFESQPILAAEAGGEATDTLVHLPHLRRWYGTAGGSPGPVTVKGRAGGFGGGFAWARSDVREVRWFDGRGRLERVARWEEEPVALTADRRDRFARAWEDAYRARGADESTVAERLRELDEELDLHEGPLPWWGAFHVDRLGNAWLAVWVTPGRPPGEWRVLARDGAYVGRVELPGIIEILDITDDRVLAVRYDELDVPAVVMLELIKG